MLEPGTRIAFYEIERELGLGGGGEIYVARDTELGRKVVLKVLPEDAESAVSRARFEREAHTIASLDHPNIVRIYGVEEADGRCFMVREWVDGRTLDTYLKDEPRVPFIDIALPLVDAVAAAHAMGIVHRDLDPKNIMVDLSGRVKILDFGLSRRADGPSGKAPASTDVSRPPSNLKYVSPELASGQPVDLRSDVFSLGILLYEIATGKHPFARATEKETIEAILHERATPVTQSNPALPAAFARLLEQCLEKEPSERLSSATALRDALETHVESTVLSDITATRLLVAHPRRRGLLVTAVLVGVVAACVGAWLWLGGDRAERALPLDYGTFDRLTSRLGLEVYPSLSPAGDLIAYAGDKEGNWDIYLQRIGGERSINLTEGSESDDTQPRFSPDGERIAFRSERDGGGVFVMGATGEAVVRAANFGYYPTWSPDGSTIAVTTQNVPDPRMRSGTSELYVIDLTTGQSRKLIESDATEPDWSPNGHRIAFWHMAEGGHRDIRTVSVDGGTPLSVTDDAELDWSPTWSPDGRYLYFSSNRRGATNVWRVAIDEETGETRGDPEPVTAETTATAQHVSFSSDGRRLAYASSVTTQNLWRVPFDPETETIVENPIAVTEGSQPLYHPQVSPDGDWIVVAENNEDLFIVKSDGSELRRLTDDDYRNREPRWSPDGTSIAFQSDRGGTYDIWTIKPDGSELKQLTDAPHLTLMAPVWSPDGSQVACWNPREDTILVFDPAVLWDAQTPQVIEARRDAKRLFSWSWSPDGTWLAGDWVHASSVYEGVAAYSFESGDIVTLTDFGSGPAFLADSRRILLTEGDVLKLVDLETGEHRDIQGAPPIDLAQVSPDNRAIYYTRRLEEADIWILSAVEPTQ